MAAVAAAECSTVVVEDIHPRLQCLLDLPTEADLLVVFLEQWENPDFHRGHAWDEAQHGADVGLALFIGEGFLVEGFANQCQHGAVAAGGWLDDVWEKFFLGLFVEVNQRFSRALFMHAEVVVGAVCHAF